MLGATDLGRALLARLPSPLAALLDDLGDAAARGGGRLWLVGGALRDLWLGDPVADADLVVEGPVEAVVAAIAAAGHAVEPKAAAFLTYRIRPSGDGPLVGDVVIDLGATRRETYARPAALPSVEPGSFEEDLWRRDVSLNAVAVGLGRAAGGALADPTGGVPDLATGRLRALHARSFEDDPTRAFRVARFAGRYGFTLDPDTRRWLEGAVAAGAVARLSPARVRAQMALLASEPILAGPLAAHEDLGLLAAVHPALAAPARVRACVREVEEAAAAWTALGLPAGDPLGRLARVLLVGRSDVDTRAALARLGFQGEPARRLAAEAAGLAVLAAWLAGGGSGGSGRALHDRLAPLGPATVVAAAGLAGPAGAATALRWALDLAARRPRLTGRDVEALGVAPGPDVGRVLDRLLTERLEGRLASRDEEEAFVRALLGGRLH